MSADLNDIRIKGSINVPGDKSISHRAVMLAGISKGKSLIRGILKSDDCLSTISCLKSLGIDISDESSGIIVFGKGLHGLCKSESILDAGNSGTTMRLISGILAGQDFNSTITGDESLRQRPMSRITVPLRNMGAIIDGRGIGEYAPLSIRGGRLKGIEYKLPIPSAQVKSAILLAGLYAENITRVIEPVISRNHTEVMMKYLGAEITRTEDAIEISKSELSGSEIEVPGDISSAAFFIAAASAIPGSELVVKSVGVNPTRTGIIDVLNCMGADIRCENLHTVCGEAVADIVVHGRQLHGTAVNGDMIPRMIDEVPVLAVIAAVAEGTTVITGAGELRVKESNRISAMVSQLGRLGVKIRELEDGIKIEGPNIIKGGEAESFGDHRIAMAMAICGLFSDGDVRIKGKEAVSISFPGFFELLSEIVV
jgi:3-phosphoshikimate 1-carboxyvinyltransferase